MAFVYSVAAQFLNLGEGFFWELVTLIDLMLLGHWLEMRSVRQASGALNELAKLMPDTAERIHHGDMSETVPASALKKGDLVLVRPGASVPADGGDCSSIQPSVFMMHPGMDGKHDYAVHLKTNDPQTADLIVHVLSNWGP